MLEPMEIPFPFGGIDISRGFEKQIPGTTVNALNVRGIDPRTGRLRGASRAGHIKWVSGTIASANPQAMIQVDYDRNMTTYTALDNTEGLEPVVEWSADNGPALDFPVCWSIALTPTGDVVWLNGNRWLIKTNPEGVTVSKVQLPMTFDSEQATTVVVADDGAIYVGTQTDPFADTASRFGGQVFRYDADPNDPNELSLTWTYDPGGRVADMRENDGILYVGVNVSATQAKLLSPTSLTAIPPLLTADRSVPAPVMQLDVNEQGEILVASAPNADRAAPPDYDLCGTKSEDFTPLDLGTLTNNPTHGPLTLRAWLKSSDIAGVTDGQFFDVWLDASGNQRHAYKLEGNGAGLLPTQFPGTRGARFVRDALCGFPAARFDGVADGSGKHPGLGSGTDGDRWFPVASRPFFVCMVVKLNAIPQDATRGIILQDPGKPFKSYIQQPDRRFTALGLDYPNGKVVDPADPDEPDDDLDRDGREVQIFTDEPDQVAIITIAFDPINLPTTAGGPGERAGSFVRVNGKMGGWNLGPTAGAVGGERMEQFTCQDASGEPMSVLLGTTPWASNEWGRFDLFEMVVVEGEFLWPGDMNTDYIDGTAATPIDAFPSDRVPSSGESEIEMIEGYLAHRYGIQSILERDSSYPQWRAVDAAGTDHPYRAAAPVGSGSSPPDVPTPSEDEAKLLSVNGIVAKFKPGSLSLIWAAQGPGLGYGVRAYGDGVWSIGKPVAGWSAGTGEIASGSVTVRKMIDKGSDADETGTGTWATVDTGMALYKGLQLEVDADENLYFAALFSSGAEPRQQVLWKYNATGTREWLFELTGFEASSGQSVALDNFTPDYGDADIGEPEFLYLGVVSPTSQLHKIRLVRAEYQVGSPRARSYYAIGDGQVSKIDPVADTVTPVGDALLNPESRIVYPVQLGGRAFVTDGESYITIDPKTDTVEAWKPRTAGRIPRRGRIMERWRNRIVVGRSDGRPYEIVGSAMGDPFDWDTDPPEILATSAFSIVNARAGAVPDVVNALIPFSDDLLIIGGNRTIHRLTGDPLASDSAFDLITNKVGIAFGRAWCMDPFGRVWFVGTDGGFYMMAPPSIPVKVSSPKIDKLFSDIDLDLYTANVCYDHIQRGIRIVWVPMDPVEAVEGGVEPAGTEGLGTAPGMAAPWTPATPDANPVLFETSPGFRDGNALPRIGWFFEIETQAWFMDILGSADIDPLAMVEIEGGSPEDRAVLILSADGHVRASDPFVGDDDGVAFQSSVTIGPIYPKSGARKARWQNWRVVLGATTATPELYLRSKDEAGPGGSSRLHGPYAISAGRNPGWRKRASGAAVWLDIFNESSGFWSLETIVADVVGSGRIRSKE